MKMQPVKFVKSLYYANTTNPSRRICERGFTEGYFMKPTVMEKMKAGKTENKFMSFIKNLFK